MLTPKNVIDSLQIEYDMCCVILDMFGSFSGTMGQFMEWRQGHVVTLTLYNEIHKN